MEEEDQQLLERYNQREPNLPSYVGKNYYGYCLYAKDNLDAGTIVATASFVPTENAYIAGHGDEEHKYVAVMDITREGEPVWGKILGKWAFCNHSCDPNCLISPTFEIITRRAVKRDQELTTSYDCFIPNFEWKEYWNFHCLCGSSDCKGYIHEFRRDLQYPILPGHKTFFHT